MENDITIKALEFSELFEDMLEKFSHKQVISEKWVKNKDHYELVKTDEVREWDKEKRAWVPQYLKEQMKRGGFVIGAFHIDEIIGFACLDGVLNGQAEKYANLTMLFVDDNWRGMGIGKKLFKEICLCAENMNAAKIFISAIPSYDTVSFYFKMGCVDAKCVINDFVDTEEDRYMEYIL